MVKNIGPTDKIVRIIVGLILLIVGLLSLFGVPLIALGGWAWLVGLIGLVLIVTAFYGYCPAYKPFGINTCKKN